MFDLFRFVVLRPPAPLDEREVIETAGESSLQRKLDHDRTQANPGPQMVQTANDFIGTDRFVSSVKALARAAGYEHLAAALQKKLPADLGELATAIKAAFAQTETDVVTDSGFTEDRKRLADSLIAAKIGDPPDGAPLALLARTLRLIALVERAAAGDPKLEEPGRMAAALRAPILLPPGLLPFPAPARPTSPAPGGNGMDNAAKKREALEQQYRDLSEARAFLHELRRENFTDFAPASAVPEPARANSHFDINESLLRELRDLQAAVSTRSVDQAAATAATLATRTRVVTGAASLMVKRDVLEQVSSGVRAGLSAVGVDLSSTPVPVAIDRLTARLTELTPQVAAQDFSSSNVAMVGRQFVPTNSLPGFR